jgi:hypothetical protein
MANSLESEKPVNIQTRSAALSDIPGFFQHINLIIMSIHFRYSYDPVTKKYYKILENIPGQVRPPQFKNNKDWILASSINLASFKSISCP